MPKPISVVIADSQAIFQLGLSQAFVGSAAVKVVARANDAVEAVSLVGHRQPDVLLIELWMDGHNSAEHFAEVFEVSPQTKVLVFATSEENQAVVSAMNAGASGFVTKQASPSDLVSILQKVHKGETYLSPQALANWMVGLKETLRIEAGQKAGTDLTVQEMAVLAAITEGRHNKEAAFLLGISPATVKYHLAHIFIKLGVRNRVEAAVLAHRIIREHSR